MSDRLNVVGVRNFPALIVCLLGILAAGGAVQAQESNPTAPGQVSLSVVNTDIAEVMHMLAEKERINILLGGDIKGTVSLTIYDADIEDAIRSVASAAGFAVERRGETYFVLKHSDVGRRAAGDLTQVRTFRVNYAAPDEIASVLKNHLSEYGKITALKQRGMLVVEDTAEFLLRVEQILKELDRLPRQILIEAKILEISLNDTETYGIDWTRFLSIDSGTGTAEVGVRGLATPTSAGLFVDAFTPNIEVALNLLDENGRVKALSTPKLLAMEKEEASVIIGDRIGFKVTTTINQVTTESIEFLESGVILRVKPAINAEGQVMLTIHPEVSNGKLTSGIPSQTTTEVTTKFIAEDGQTIFIGGLIKNNISEKVGGVPVLRALPLLGRLFSNREKISSNTETVVMITPHILGEAMQALGRDEQGRIDSAEQALAREPRQLEKEIGRYFPD